MAMPPLRRYVHRHEAVAMTLTEAGAQLGLSPATLRSQIRNGALRGTMIGKTWTVTPREVERYRLNRLGKRGRPRKA
jgi:excisionase family DNA binding protein